MITNSKGVVSAISFDWIGAHSQKYASGMCFPLNNSTKYSWNSLLDSINSRALACVKVSRPNIKSLNLTPGYSCLA